MAFRPILGIDPGSRAMGYGIILDSGAGIKFETAGVLRPPQDLGLAEKLLFLFDGLIKIIDHFKPTVSAVEAVFNARNARSALILGHARGVALLASSTRALQVFEYTPAQVKQAVVGYGRAEKSQVQQMVKLLLNLQKAPAQDAADALAVAICHANSTLNRIAARPGLRQGDR